MNKYLVTSIISGALAGGFVSLLVSQSLIPQGADQQRSAEIAQTINDNAIVSTVEASSPAVVSIIVTKDVPVIEQFFEEVPSNPFGGFFGQGPFSFGIPRLRQNGTQEQEIGGGSGFLISSDGMIVTNRHVVDDPDASYTIYLSDGTSYKATVLARDPVTDIAILTIDALDLPFLSFTDSDQLKVGQTVIAIGNSLGEFRNTVSAGIISGLSRSIRASDGAGQSEQLEEVLQTDAAINPGNSGGPLLDLGGNVVGVNVAVALGSENIGFALPANLVQSIVDSVKETGKISRPYIGVRYTAITPAMQEANNLSVDYGVLLVAGESSEELAVIPGSPANKVGLVEGDILLEVDGQRLDLDHSLASIIRQKQIGESIELKVLSRGEEKTLTLILEEFPENE